MIPQISQAPGVVQLVLNFLQELEQQGFTGDTATSYADRLTMSTDNSIYQLLPDAVVFPRSTADVALIARLAAQERYSSLIFTPRGGGTGTNGQALNQGIIVDMSRHMNRIIEINPEEGWVRVEAGVIKDQLNQYLKPFGYFFAPELSTSNRATLGGMINPMHPVRDRWSMAKRQITYLAYARCCWGAIFSIRNLYPSSWRKRWVNPIPQSGEFITRFINVAVSNAS